MLTLKEVMTILMDRYSTEEIVQIIDPDVEDLVINLESSIQGNWDRVCEYLEEDGYAEDV